MNALRRLHRVLTALQSRLWIRVLCSVLAIAGTTAYFVPLLSTSYTYDSSARGIVNSFAGPEGQRFSDTLRETGSVKIDGVVRTIEPELLATLYDDDGKLVDLRFTIVMLLKDTIPEWAPIWLLQQPTTTWIFYVTCTAWLLLITWMSLLYPFLLTCLGTTCAVLIAWWLGSRNLMFAVGGFGLLLFSFVLLVRLVSILISSPRQVLAIAHTVIKEASRSRISLIFIVALLALLPMLPFWLDPDSPLRHRVQTFISRSVGMTFVFCACMTIVLGCATVAFEIRDRQIWQIMCKPVGKFRYILGKWLGILLLNAVVIFIAGISTFMYIQYLRTTDVAEGMQGDLDRLAVSEEVLTARRTDLPIYPPIPEELLQQYIQDAFENDPLREGQEEIPAYLERRLRRQFERDLDFTRRMVPPGREGEPGLRTFEFAGLSETVGTVSPLTLRYRFLIGGSETSDVFTCGFMFNGDPQTMMVREYVPTMSHFVTFPPSFVRPDGTIAVTIVNFTQMRSFEGQAQIYFDEEDLEILYKVGGFEANFLRAMIVMLIKLGFLAGLSIFCATFLSFPVACLSSFTIFMAATMGPYLAYALEFYVPVEANRVEWSNLAQVIQWLFESGIRKIAQASVFMLEAFGQYRPTNDLVNGLVVPWGKVLGSFLRLAVIWSGLSLVLGYVVLRNRQLAIYSGGQS